MVEMVALFEANNYKNCHRPLAEAKKEERKYMCLDKENKL